MRPGVPDEFPDEDVEAGRAAARNTMEFDCAGLETDRRVADAGVASLENSAGGGRKGIGTSSCLAGDVDPLTLVLPFRTAGDPDPAEFIVNAAVRRTGGSTGAFTFGVVDAATGVDDVVAFTAGVDACMVTVGDLTAAAAGGGGGGCGEAAVVTTPADAVTGFEVAEDGTALRARYSSLFLSASAT